MNIYEGPVEGIKGLLIYKIDQTEYCSDIQSVAAIIKTNEIKQSTKQNYLSRIEFDHSVFSIIDMHKIYETKPLKQTDSNRLILHEIYGKNFCFFVDKVLEILSTDRLFMEKSMDLLPYSGKNLIRYILKYQKRNIFFPDFEKITKSLYKLNEFYKMV